MGTLPLMKLGASVADSSVLYHFDLMFMSRVTGALEHPVSRVPRGREHPIQENHGRHTGAYDLFGGQEDLRTSKLFVSPGHWGGANFRAISSGVSRVPPREHLVEMVFEII